MKAGRRITLSVQRENHCGKLRNAFSLAKERQIYSPALALYRTKPLEHVSECPPWYRVAIGCLNCAVLGGTSTPNVSKETQSWFQWFPSDAKSRPELCATTGGSLPPQLA